MTGRFGIGEVLGTWIGCFAAVAVIDQRYIEYDHRPKGDLNFYQSIRGSAMVKMHFHLSGAPALP